MSGPERCGIADLAERFEDGLPETAPAQRPKERPQRPFIADLAQRLGCGIVEPALVVAAKAGEQRIDGPAVPDLAEGLRRRHADVLITVSQPVDQGGHGAAVPDVAENVDDELPHVRIGGRDHAEQGVNGPTARSAPAPRWPNFARRHYRVRSAPG